MPPLVSKPRSAKLKVIKDCVVNKVTTSLSVFLQIHEELLKKSEGRYCMGFLYGENMASGIRIDGVVVPDQTMTECMCEVSAEGCSEVIEKLSKMDKDYIGVVYHQGNFTVASQTNLDTLETLSSECGYNIIGLILSNKQYNLLQRHKDRWDYSTLVIEGNPNGVPV